MDPIKLWQEKKWLFFILLPIILIVVFKDLLISIIRIIGLAKANKTNAEVESLETKANESNAKAEEHLANVEDIKKKREALKTADISDDWHKRK